MSSNEEFIKIAVTQRITEASRYVERRDALAHDWIATLRGWKAQPLLVPNTWRAPTRFVDSWGVQAILLTGGNDPITPGVAATGLLAPERDETERELIAYAITRGIPIIGICRGAQVLNLYFEGTLSEVEGHRATTHRVRVADWIGLERQEPAVDSALSATGRANGSRLSDNEVEVNSYHQLGMTSNDLSNELRAFAWGDDNTVEAFFHPHMPLLGAMWHPERPAPPHAGLNRLFGQVLRGAMPWTAAATTEAK